MWSINKEIGLLDTVDNARRRDVVARVGELRAPAQAKITERLEITLESLIERAVNLYEMCLRDKAYGRAVSALKEIGVLSGARVERSERGEPNEVERMSDEELRQFIKKGMEAFAPSETQH